MKAYLNSGFLLIGLGITGMILSAFADSIGLGHPGFGLTQLSGFVIGGLATGAGFLKVYPKKTRTLALVFTIICVSGILYMGLRPNTHKNINHTGLLDVQNFSWGDFAVNTVGFLPLGYLLMLTFESRQKESQKANLFRQAIIVAGLGGLVSLFLEVSQYHLAAGRACSLFDCIANTLGTLLGIALYLVM